LSPKHVRGLRRNLPFLLLSFPRENKARLNKMLTPQQSPEDVRAIIGPCSIKAQTRNMIGQSHDKRQMEAKSSSFLPFQVF
jgi:hypothetical protein